MVPKFNVERGAVIELPYPSVGATENARTTALLAPGATLIKILLGQALVATANEASAREAIKLLSPALQVETKIPPGGTQEGTVIVGFPVTKQAFEQRQSLSVTLDAYDRPSLVLKQQSPQQ